MNDSVLTWDGNWAWSLPLIVLNVMLHVAGLVLINRAVLELIERMRDGRSFNVRLGLVYDLRS